MELFGPEREEQPPNAARIAAVFFLRTSTHMTSTNIDNPDFLWTMHQHGKDLVRSDSQL